MWILTENKRLVNTEQVSEIYLEGDVEHQLSVFALMADGSGTLLEYCESTVLAERKVENLRCVLKGIKIEDI